VAPPEQRKFMGKTYASKAEMLYAVELHMMLDAGLIIEYIEQPRLWLGVPENKYIPDFLVIPRDGIPYYVDVKGMETAVFKKNKRLWRAYGRLQLFLAKRKRDRFEVYEIVEGGHGETT
tara:strand:- start:213 stop:569 length:357 start_codon:yes stop_codon:yes gene_type:complete